MKKNILLLVFTSLFLNNLNSFTEKGAKRVAVGTGSVYALMGLTMGISADYVFSKEEVKGVPVKGLIGGSILGFGLGCLLYKGVLYDEAPSSKLNNVKEFIKRSYEKNFMSLDFDNILSEDFLKFLEKNYQHKDTSLISLHNDLITLLYLLNSYNAKLEKHKADFIKSGFEKEYSEALIELEGLKMALHSKLKKIYQNDSFLIQDKLNDTNSQISNFALAALVIFYYLPIKAFFNYKYKARTEQFKRDAIKNVNFLNKQVKELEARLTEIESEDHENVAFA